MFEELTEDHPVDRNRFPTHIGRELALYPGLDSGCGGGHPFSRGQSSGGCNLSERPAGHVAHVFFSINRMMLGAVNSQHSWKPVSRFRDLISSLPYYGRQVA